MITKEAKFEMIYSILNQPGNLIQLNDFAKLPAFPDPAIIIGNHQKTLVKKKNYKTKKILN